MTAYEKGFLAGRQSIIYGTFHDNPYAECACSDCYTDACEWNEGFSDGQADAEKVGTI
jgi:hypothetical protein